MAYKVERRGNYLILTDTDTNKEIEGNASSVLITRETDSSDVFWFRGLNNDILPIDFADLLDKEGLAWADLQTWVDWYSVNTGGSFSSGGDNGGGVVESVKDLIGSSLSLNDGQNISIGTETWGGLNAKYESIEFQMIGKPASFPYRESRTISTLNWANDTRIAFLSDNVNLLQLIDMDSSGSTATIDIGGSAGSFTPCDVFIYGVKSQEVVVNTEDTPVDMSPVGVPISPTSTKSYTLQWDGVKIVNTLSFEHEIIGDSSFECNHLTGSLTQQGSFISTSDSAETFNFPNPFLTGSVPNVVITRTVLQADVSVSLNLFGNATETGFIINRRNNINGTNESFNWQAVGLKP